MEQREGGDIFFQDFIQEEIEVAGHGQVSQILDFLEGTTVFITGGTGFLGQVLIEKLLRLTKVKKIYTLIRSKGTKSPKERLLGVLNGVLFTPVAQHRQDFNTTVTAIPGDLGLPDLGLSAENREILLREVHVVFHTGASSHSNHDLRIAALVNVRGTKLLLQLSKEMRRIKCFIYVSSAYSNSNVSEIKESVYPASLNYHKLLSLIDILDDENLDLIKPNLLRDWPNCQIFSKHVVEDMIKELESWLPIGIIRPSILISTALEPLVGWVNNSEGPQEIASSALSGIMRVFYAKEQCKADIVPVDLVVSAMLAFATQVGNARGDGPNMEDLSQMDNYSRPEAMVPVLNYVSQRRNQITWGYFMSLCFLHGLAIPKLSDFSVPNISFQSTYALVVLQQWIYHYIPAAFFDALLYLAGSKPKWISTYKKLHASSKSFAPFTTKQWKFQDNNVGVLWDKLGAKDKTLFKINLSSIDWNEYVEMYIRGIRTYIGKENMDTLPEAKLRMKKLKIIYYGGQIVTAAVLFYLIGQFYSNLP